MGCRDPSGDCSLEFPENGLTVDNEDGIFRYPGRQRVYRKRRSGRRRTVGRNLLQHTVGGGGNQGEEDRVKEGELVILPN